MFPTKVAGVLFAVFATIAGILFAHLWDGAAQRTEADLSDRLRVAHRAVDGARRLTDFALAARASEIAASAALGSALTAPKEQFKAQDGGPPTDEDHLYGVHRLVNDEIAAWAAKFGALADGKAEARPLPADWRREKPDIFEVVDKGGIGVASAADKAWYGAQADEGARFPALKQALADGTALVDIWIVKEVPFNVAVEPIRANGAVVGAVILGARLSDAEAKRDQAGGYEVAYFVGDRVSHSSTLDTAGESALAVALKDQKLVEKAGRSPAEFTLGAKRYLAFAGMLTGHVSAPQAGFVVFANLESALERGHDGLHLIPVLALGGFLLALGLMLALFRQFMQPYEEMDQGVVEIINGNLDRWFEAPAKHPAGTLAQNVNVMVCQLSGRPLPDDDEDESGRPIPHGEHWAEDRMFIEEIDASEFGQRPVDAAQAEGPIGVAASANSQSGLAPDILRLVRETEDAYRKRLFRDYTEALRAAGEPVQGITFDKFFATLQATADLLREKYGCTRVRFLVQTRDGKVSLKPVPIK